MSRNDKDPLFDPDLARRLRAEAPEPAENPWFTPRVVNRLPRRNIRRRFIWTTALVVVAVLAITWYCFLADFPTDVITVGDMVYFLAMVGGTGAVALVGLATMMRHE